MAWPGFTVSERIVGAILVIARFNPLKKFGPLTGRTRGSPLPMRLYRKKKKSGGGFSMGPHEERKKRISNTEQGISNVEGKEKKE
jgi:hypothetical protein